MASLNGFNAAEVQPSEGFDVLPAGEYKVCIVESEMTKTKAGTGDLLKLTLQVLDGPYQNRKVFEQINYNNPSPKAQEIGRGTLSAICRAVGVLTPGDSSELHNRPMLAKLKIKKQEGYNDQNEVTKYSPINKTEASGAPPAPPATAAAWAGQA